MTKDWTRRSPRSFDAPMNAQVDEVHFTCEHRAWGLCGLVVAQQFERLNAIYGSEPALRVCAATVIC
jgi:hypothetical protein